MKGMKMRNVLLSCAAAAMISGCSSGSDSGAGVAVQSTEDYATRSEISYGENRYGLVGGEYAARLITDWSNSKPAGKRNLFVMQFNNVYGFEGTHTEQISETETAEVGNGYLKSDPSAGVYVFDRTSGCTSTGDSRGDGVSSVPKPVFSIEQMDAAFAMYGIDPNQDMMLLVLGAPSPSKPGEYMAGVARMWYTLTYWGFPQESIMLLNGQASSVLNPEVNSAVAALGITRNDLFTSLPSALPSDPQWQSVSTVRQDGTILQATMEDMMQVIDANDPNDLIIDARSSAEYEGTKQAKTEYSLCGENHDEQCYTAFDGHMRGAKNLYFTDVLNIDDETSDINNDGAVDYKDATFSFRPIEQIDSIFEAAGYRAGNQVYVYCRTGTKASLLTFTSAAVLGYKTRMYDGSWIQWGKMANMEDTFGHELLPFDSRWRTDLYSENVVYNSVPSSISPLNADELNLDADHTDKIILEDKASK